ncbi:hypothetical protein DNTS_023895 [Danionella cerebrum]|uniref:Protein max n=1 Tax=Danionella cerebrum TaxID=2873325 RepID=A0A553MUX0_9TELE|nr:hypothetical protein DNTS_023895 [Danionella translucida]
MSDNDDIEVDSDADKRAHHNALERKRRDHIKDSFHSLRDSVPALQGEKYGHWRKSKGPHSFRPTTPLQTAACTPTPRAALCLPLTAGRTPARNRSRKNSDPGRNTVERTAKHQLHIVLPEGRESSAMASVL